MYGQPYSALVVYVLLKYFYDTDTGGSMVPHYSSLDFARFSRLLLHDQLPKIWLVQLSLFQAKNPFFNPSYFPLSS